MPDYAVGKPCEFAPSAAVAVQAGRRTIAVFRVGYEFFAVSNARPHKGASLCDGEIVADVAGVHGHYCGRVLGHRYAGPRRRYRRVPHFRKMASLTLTMLVRQPYSF
jgi:hypothetical protein